jgi:hypothetical protein
MQHCIQCIDRKRNKTTMSPAYFCTTAHFLEWKGGYGEDMKLRPGVKGAARLELKYCGAGNSDAKRVRGDLFN